MAQDPDKPKDNGKLGLPKIAQGMNKLPPVKRAGGKGSKDDGTDSGEKARKSEDAKLLGRIRKRFERCVSAEADNRKDGLDDDKFVKGDQWSSSDRAARSLDNRPCLTINKLPTFVHQITNDQRQNRPAINISPVGDRGDIEVAKMYRGLIRQIERASTADIAYDTAFESSVRKGWGWFRLITKFEGPDTFNQVLSIQRIRNAFSVYADPASEEPDGADMKFGFVTEMLPRNEFDELYPDAQPMPFDLSATGDTMKNWVSSDEIRVAEYFEIVNESRALVRLSNGHEGWKDKLDEKTVALIDKGEMEIERERNSSVPTVKWYKVSAIEVLERKDWVGQWIPLFRVIGNEIDIEGKVTYSGVVRNAKDAQRQYNYWKTKETEAIALAPNAPWIMEEGQIEGHEDEWRTANTRPIPVLQYKGTSLAGTMIPPPQRQQFSGIPAGIVNASQGAAQDMMATTGIRFDATLQERVVDESGRALREIRRSGDIASFHYVDNLSRTLKHLGRCLVDAIPKVYDTKRMLTILREDDTEEQVQIDPNAPKGMQEQKNPQTGKTLKIFNPTYGEYGVTVSIGPSYATKRIEAAESMMDFARALPQTAEVFMDLIAKNSDWPGAAEISTRLAKLVATKFPGVMQPDMKDVPPQVQAMLQGMDAQIKQMTQHQMQLMKALTDKEADRQIDRDKIDKDFEAKLLSVVQKAESNFQTHIGSEIKALADGVKLLHQHLTAPERSSSGQEQAPA